MPHLLSSHFDSASAVVPITAAFSLYLTVDGEGRLCAAQWVESSDFDAPALPSRHPRLAQWVTELQAWKTNPSHQPEAQFAPVGSPFQQRVWKAIAAIPYGEVRTYAQLAQAVGSHPRPVAAACRANPFPLFIPCHRVIGQRGKLTGYAGHRAPKWLALKRWLLQREGYPSLHLG